MGGEEAAQTISTTTDVQFLPRDQILPASATRDSLSLVSSGLDGRVEFLWRILGSEAEAEAEVELSSASSHLSAFAPISNWGHRIVTFEDRGPGVREGVARVIFTGSKRGFLSVSKNCIGLEGGRVLRSGGEDEGNAESVRVGM